jgi:hypothetical protein
MPVITNLPTPPSTSDPAGFAAKADAHVLALQTFTAEVNAFANDLNALGVLPSGGVFSTDISLPDEAYGAGWNGSLEVPTKNAVYDKIETIGAPPVAASNAEYVTGTDTTKFLNSATARARNIVQGTSIASTSGTSIDFTGIPSWAKRITIMFSGVSTSGTANLQVQLGDSGGIEVTGYLGSSAGITSNSGFSSVASTSAFVISDNSMSSAVRHGSLTLTLLDSATNTWVIQGVVGQSEALRTSYIGGSKSLSATLTQVRITTANGTDTFDAGSINILYE